MFEVSSFERYVQSKIEEIDEAIFKRVPVASVDDANKYLYAPAAQFVKRGGKRIRPVLTLMSAEAFGADPKNAMSAAIAVELFQGAALIHDDIADESDTRRGEPCLHLAEGEGLAINAGDMLLVESTKQVIDDSSIDAGTKISLLKELSKMMQLTCEGQALDLGWARDKRWDISVFDYIEMATLKTAHYSVASPLVLGAIIAGVNSSELEILRQFGINSGLAFQIQDDYLNIAGDKKAQGKDILSDITEGKRSFLVVSALEKCDSSSKDRLIQILEKHTKDITELIEAKSIIESSGAITEAISVATQFANEAVELSYQINFKFSDASAALSQMPMYLVTRCA